MKVLVVCDQYIDIKPDGCYCSFAFLGTLKNFSVMGDIHVIAAKLLPNKPAAQPVNQKLDFISPDRVKHFKPLTSSIGQYLENRSYNRKLLSETIPQMDLVIGYTPGHNMNYAFKIAKKHKVPYMSFLVASPWDIMRYHQRWIVRLLAPFYSYSTKRILLNSDYVHYVTSSFLQKNYPTKGKSLGCSDINLGEPRQGALDERLEKLSGRGKEDKIKIVTIGHTDIRYKGQEFVIRAIAKLEEMGENRYHYYLIGAGEGVYLKNLAEKLNIGENVHFLGRKSPDEVMTLLADADIYIQPSLTEGLPRAVVEAMSVALPCIGFDVGGIPELIDLPYIVKKGDVSGLVKCIKILDDEGVYKSASIRSFEKSGEYAHNLLTFRIQKFFSQIKNDIFAR